MVTITFIGNDFLMYTKQALKVYINVDIKPLISHTHTQIVKVPII